jgi:2-polyprenyl-3-methyl-5-hydroxy-6-metoxy-1,4-benzoquinol methylase
MSVDYQHGTTIDRENAYYWDDPRLDKFVRGAYRRQIIKDALRAGTKVLDLCCGNGWLALELARSGANVLGVDVCEERIRVATRHVALIH